MVACRERARLDPGTCCTPADACKLFMGFRSCNVCDGFDIASKSVQLGLVFKAWCIQEADAMGLSDEIGSAAQIFAAEVLAGFGGSGRRAGAAADAARANSAPHAASCSTPQSTAQAQSLPPLAMSSSNVSESSVAALGCSMDEEECG